MLSYKEFIKESVGQHYDSFYIKILSRKSPEEAIELLKKDTLTRSFRREHNWEVEDQQNKILKVYLDSPETKEKIKQKVKGRHKDLKYVLHGFGEPIEGIKSTDKEKEALKFLTDDHFINKTDISDVFIGMYRLFMDEHSWTVKYKKEWNDFVNSKYVEITSELPSSRGLSAIVVLNNKPYNEEVVKFGFDLIMKAINNGDLDIDPNWIRSLTAVKKFNLF